MWTSLVKEVKENMKQKTIKLKSDKEKLDINVYDLDRKGNLKTKGEIKETTVKY